MTAKPNLTWETVAKEFEEKFNKERISGKGGFMIFKFDKLKFFLKSTLTRVLKEVMGEEVIAHSVLGTEIDRAFVRGFNQAIKEACQRIKAMGLEEGK